MATTAPRLDLKSLLLSGDLWLGDRQLRQSRTEKNSEAAPLQNQKQFEDSSSEEKSRAVTLRTIQRIIEKVPTLVGDTSKDQSSSSNPRSQSPYSFGLPEIDTVLKHQALQPHALHEFALENDCTNKLSNTWYPPLFSLCQILKTTADKQRSELSLQANSLLCAWVGRRSWPTIQLLDSFLKNEWRKRCLFIAPEDKEQRLWAATQILRSGCFSAVVLDGTRLDFAATRRLQLAAKEGNSVAFMVRPPWEIEERSAAVTRWLFTPVPSTEGAGAEESRPRWRLTLKKARGTAGEHSWIVEFGKGALTIPESAPSTRFARSEQGLIEDSVSKTRRRNAG